MKKLEIHTTGSETAAINKLVKAMQRHVDKEVGFLANINIKDITDKMRKT